mmetsp:Transcript_14080/g.21992  ORF Transcript_14080/g.21992 Transcript_14080/m.21992 type:complete len:501 (-) Transcript_14080:347-1849(-)|eukprot:CAMPEP_0195293002 /NCGR_PEP_ID=MMETSP0707-20130614/11391_1 /TAXON_ID=33640 /ORGANISM="Asterionellopsis glacialis, Strain CCMP134" /LENGTH=500 /DNA_ID=CAMNT_0040353607 /DNA_START=76 /DNA_END=1578 /DNA_ORIENTATION=+
MEGVATQHVFFIGLGGIGMSSLARHLQSIGHVVGGYDLTPSPLLATLASEGMTVTHSPNPNDLPEWAQHGNPDDLTVVWTPAVPRDIALFRHFSSLGIEPIKRAALLGQITNNYPTLAVAGTHGKTTTSSWLAAMLNDTPDGCHAFVGGLDAITGSNYCTREGAEWHVVEADEFDRSFHHLHPTHAAIINIDPDHLDIYGTEEAFRQGFEHFGAQVTQSLIIPHDLAWPQIKLESGPQVERFAVIQEDEEIPEEVNHLAILSPKDGEVRFILGRSKANHKTDQNSIEFTTRPSLPGRHNTANALVACALAWHAGVEKHHLARVVKVYKGVKRRMDIHLDTPKAVYVDDYAHHPTELSALLQAVRERWPDRHVTLIFQPHLFSRTRDFESEFARILGLSDRLFVLPIYPAREAPIPGVDAQRLVDRISSTDKHLSTFDSIFSSLKVYPVDILVTAGAGTIDRLVPQAIEYMQDCLTQNSPLNESLAPFHIQGQRDFDLYPI